MEVLAVIPARGGSKAIPRKNLVPFCGKPLVAWMIEAANAAANVSRVVVSTDDPEIGTVSNPRLPPTVHVDLSVVSPSNSRWKYRNLIVKSRSPPLKTPARLSGTGGFSSSFAIAGAAAEIHTKMSATVIAMKNRSVHEFCI